MKLYPYQEEGARFLAANRRAYLADVPGLGKTAQALTAARQVQAQKILVVCPAVAIPVWHAERDNWWSRYHPEIHVVSYGKLANNPDKYARERDLVILDEAHYVKSPDAQRTEAALNVAQRADRAWLLSGTPMPNDPSELYTIFASLWPLRMPSWIDTADDWRDHFCRWYLADYGRGCRAPKITGSKNSEQLVRMLDGGTRDVWHPMMLRRRIRDVELQLPPLRLHVVPLPADRRFAEELETYIEEHGMYTATVRRLLGAHKAKRIAKIVGDELLSPIVLMYHHRDTGKLLREKLIRRGWRTYGFDGSHTPTQRANEVSRFQADPKGPKVFIVQQQAGGTAITLTAAAEIILVEPDWSPGVNAQAIKRVHRIGSVNPVRARIFSVLGSLDEAIMDTLARKIRMRQEVLDVHQ